MVLNEKAALNLEEERNRADRIMDLLMKDKEVKRLLLRKMQGLYASSQLPLPSSTFP
jgi:hypothetical protein